MDVENRLELIKQVGEEIITIEELKHLLQTKEHPIAYDGFEPSGTNIHIAQGLLRAINVNKMTQAGCKFKFLVADWHAWANNKMDGNLEHIQKVGKYLIEVWKACDMDFKNVEFIWASDLAKDDNYWKLVMQVAINSTVNRIIRCGQIMGRKESEVLQASQILYPCMQCADIFYLKANVTQLGRDQRKVNALAREIGPKLGFWKPVIVSHHMLPSLLTPEKAGEEVKTLELGLNEEFSNDYFIELHSVDDPRKRRRKIGGIAFDTALKLIQGIVYDDETVAIVHIYNKRGELLEEVPIVEGKSTTTKVGIGIKCLEINREGVDKAKVIVYPGKLQLVTTLKMSKSNPDSAIFMNDEDDEIKRKIKNAYCPEGIIEENPILEYNKYIIFEKFNNVKIERPEKFGGNLEFNSYEDLEKAFSQGKLHPMDLKNSTAFYLNKLIEPIREKLEKNNTAKKLAEEIKTFKVTK